MYVVAAALSYDSRRSRLLVYPFSLLLSVANHSIANASMIPHNSSTRRSTSLSSANSNNPPTFPSLNKEITRSISTSIANVIERNVNGSTPEKRTSLLTSFKQLHEPTIKSTKKFSIENTKRGQSEDRQLFHLLQESKSTSQDQPLLSFKSDPSPSQMENNVSTDSDSLQQEIHSLRQRHL